MDPDEVTVLDSFVGRRLVGWSQDPYSGSGDQWADEEPLRLVFDGGVVLELQPLGWHDSGSLVVRAATVAACG